LSQSKLLDPNFNNLTIHDESGLSTHAIIVDQDEKIVGEIKQVGHLRTHFLLLDSDGSKIGRSSKKVWSLGATYEIRDSENKLLGTVREKMHSLYHEIRMYDTNNKIILISKHTGRDDCYEIADNNEKSIALFRPKDDKRKKIDRFMRPFPPTNIFEIKDNSFDRKTLLCFFICLYNEIFGDYQNEPASGC